MTLAHCKTCGAPIVWTFTTQGKRMPVDPDPVVAVRGFRLNEDEDPPQAVFTAAPEPGERLFQSHFSTCPQAEQHRKSA